MVNKSAGSLLVMIITVLTPATSYALEIEHTPPERLYEQQQQEMEPNSNERRAKTLEAVLSVEQIKRARILAPTINGLRVIDFERESDLLVARLDAEITGYRIHAEGYNQEVSISPYYKIIEPTPNKLQNELNALITESNIEHDKLKALESQLKQLERTKVSDLAKQRTRELAQASILLHKKERELKQVKQKVGVTQ